MMIFVLKYKMILSFTLRSLGVFSVLLISFNSVRAADYIAPKYRFNLPPSVDLDYLLRVQQSGIALTGEAQLKWRVQDKKYHVSTESRAMLFGKVAEASSEGIMTDSGLAPITFIEKRFRKDATTTTFNRANKLISFGVSAETYPIKGGEQDRNSVIWQLIGVARAAPEKFKAGSKWGFFVVGSRDAEPWTFTVAGQEKLHTSWGEINTVHVLRAPPPDSKSQQLDIWLAPSMEWYPLRLRFSESGGDFIEQSLEALTKISP